jgi:hypothetical protein
MDRYLELVRRPAVLELWRNSMRRTAALVAAVGLLATGVAIAAPAGAAALKPGVPTAVKAVPTAKGTVNLTWKAPAVKKGKTAKATSYTVVCTGTKKVTVKTTKASVVIVSLKDKKYVGYKENVVCTVSAVAGKAVGKAAKSAAFTAYYKLMAATFTLQGDAVTKYGSKLTVKAPATNNTKTHTLSFPIVNSVANPSSWDDSAVLAGWLIVSGAPANKMTLVADPAGDSDHPIYDLQGYASSLHSVVQFMVIKNITVDPSTMVAKGDMFLTSNANIVNVLKLLGINAVAGEQLGTVTLG